MEDQTPSTFLLEFTSKSGKEHLNLYMNNTLIGGITALYVGVDLIEKVITLNVNIVKELEKTAYMDRSDVAYLSANSENSSIVLKIETDTFSFNADSDFNITSSLDLTNLTELLIDAGAEQEKVSVNAIYNLF